MHMLTAKQHQWRNSWPHILIGFLAFIQFFLTICIVGAELTSLIFDFYHSMIFAGFYCSFFFTITWISMFSLACCNRHSIGCATNGLVQNILSSISASVLIYFDSVFLQNPFTCYFASTYDCYRIYDLSSLTYSGIYDSTKYTIKMYCIKGQLACAAAMLSTNVLYIIIYLIVSIKTRNQPNQIIPQQYGGIQPMPMVPHPTYDQARPMVMVNQGTFVSQQPILETQQRNNGQLTIECQNCHHIIAIS